MQRRQFIAALAALGAAGTARAAAPARAPDVIFMGTPNEVLDRMFELAGVSANDVVYDLGSGDGRIPIAAAQRYGARGVGIDIDPELVAAARANAKAARVEDKVRFVEGDLFEADISEATVVTLYLLNSLNAKLRPKLLKDLRPGTRVVSHAFTMGDWVPERTIDMGRFNVYLWRIPPKP